MIRRVPLRCALTLAAAAALAAAPAFAGSQPVRAKNGMVASQNFIASQVGRRRPVGGRRRGRRRGGDLVRAGRHPPRGGQHRRRRVSPVTGRRRAEPVAYDFRETAPAGATPTMFMRPATDGAGRRDSLPPSRGASGGRDAAAPSLVYDPKAHHEGHLAVGVPGTVAGLYMAWKENGRLPWRRLIEPAIRLAREGFIVSRRAVAVAPGRAAEDEAVPGLSGAVLPGGNAVRAGRPPEADRPRGHAGAHRGQGARRLLRGPHRAAHREGDEGARRAHHAGRPRGLRREAPPPPAGHLPRLRRHHHAPDQLRRDGAARDAQRAGGVRPLGPGVRLRGHRAPDGGVHAPRLRGAGALPGRPRLQPRHADRPPRLEGVRGGAAAHDRGRERLALLARPVRVAGGERRDDPRLRGGRRPQRGLPHLHPGGPLRREDRGARRGLPAQQRDGRLQRRPRPHHRGRPRGQRRRTWPPRQAHAVEHDAHHPREGRQALPGDRAAPAAARSSTPCCRRS